MLKKKFKLFDRTLLSISDNNGKLNLFSLAFPFFLESVFVSLLNLVNTVLCSNFDESYVSAVSVGGQVFGFLTIVMSVIPTGLAILLSISLGLNDKERCKSLIGTSVICSLIVGILFGIIGFFLSKPILSIMNLQGKSLELAEKYLKIRALSLVLTSLTYSISEALRSYGFALPTIVIGIVTNVVNTLLSVVAIYKIPFVLFPDEISGLAFSCVISQAIGLIVGFLMYRHKRIPCTLHVKFNILKQLLKVGLPGSVSIISYNLSTLITTSIITYLSEAMLNTKIYVTQIVYYVYVFGFSIGRANAILIGRACGHGDIDKANAMFWHNMRITLLCNTVLAVVVAIFQRPLLSVFTSNPDIFAYAYPIFFIDILVEIFRGANHIGEKGLGSTGDVRYTTIVSIISCWVNGIGLSYLFAIVCKLGLIGIWIAFAVDELFRAIMYACRWRSGKWKKSFRKIIA